MNMLEDINELLDNLEYWRTWSKINSPQEVPGDRIILKCTPVEISLDDWLEERRMCKNGWWF